MTRTATGMPANVARAATVAGVWSQLADPADPLHVAEVVTAARAARPRAGAVRVVAIDGPSGSGKTTLAAGVAEALACPVAHMDEIFPGWDGLAPAVDLVTAQVLEPLARGGQAAYRVWDWTGRHWGRTITLPHNPFLVLEGCGSSVGAAGRYAALRVWVEAGRDERMRRGIARDGATYAPFWERWAAQEDAVFGADHTRERADLIIDTSGLDV